MAKNSGYGRSKLHESRPPFTTLIRISFHRRKLQQAQQLGWNEKRPRWHEKWSRRRRRRRTWNETSLGQFSGWIQRSRASQASLSAKLSVRWAINGLVRRFVPTETIPLKSLRSEQAGISECSVVPAAATKLSQVCRLPIHANAAISRSVSPGHCIGRR